MSEEESKPKSITVKLPSQLVEVIDQLKGEYGVRSRGQVLEILLEDLLGDGADKGESNPSRAFDDAAETSSEESSLVLIRPSGSGQDDVQETSIPSQPSSESIGGIDLPGFVRRRTSELRETLQTPKRSRLKTEDPVVVPVSLACLLDASQAAEDHWLSLYGQPPGATVVEAAMLWLSRDLWPNLDASDGRSFTWSAANAAMEELCSDWDSTQPSLGRVMVIAGALEDPFATDDLAQRIPTLVRRFVNRFRRSRRSTSFETLESTMTVHGALKLLGLSTQAGASVTLSSIRDAYKIQARAAHPDAGGSTDSMRRLNEAYKLLRELYRH